MNITLLIIFFILGTYFGSMYTVIGQRLPKNEDFIIARSHCDNCNHTLSLLDMVPILSYIFLKGRCRYCNAKIDITSTFMELFSGILFATAFYVFGTTYELFIAIGIISLLMIIIVSDINYYIIPDEILIFMSIYFIVFNLINLGPKETFDSVCSGIILFSIMYTIMIIGNKVLKKETLGGGDIKLMFVFGIILGPILGLFSIFIGSVIALPVSIFMLKKEKESIIPFGPFLLIALTLLYFTGITPEIILNLLKVY